MQSYDAASHMLIGASNLCGRKEDQDCFTAFVRILLQQASLRFQIVTLSRCNV